MGSTDYWPRRLYAITELNLIVVCWQYAYRPMLMQNGLRDQIKVDQGNQGVGSILSIWLLPEPIHIGPPHLQSTSTMVDIYCVVWQCGTFH